MHESDVGKILNSYFFNRLVEISFFEYKISQTFKLQFNCK